MSSLALIRLMTSKNVHKLLIARHLSIYSDNCIKRSSQNLFANKIALNYKNNRSHDLTPQSVSSRSISSSSVDKMSANASASHNHSTIWSVERYLSMGLLAIIPAAFVVPMPAMDYLLALSLVTHVHWGIEAIVVDYIRPNIFGKLMPKLALGSVYLLSIVSVGGLFYFNYTDVGLVQAIRMIAKM